MVGSAIVRKLLDHGYGQEQNGGKVLSPTRKELDLLIGLNKLLKKF